METDVLLQNDPRLGWCADLAPGKPLRPWHVDDLLRLYPRACAVPSLADVARSVCTGTDADAGALAARALAAPGVGGDARRGAVALLCADPALFVRVNTALLDRDVLELLRLRWLLCAALAGLRTAPEPVPEPVPMSTQVHGPLLYRAVRRCVRDARLVPGAVVAWHGFTLVHTASADARRLLWDAATRTYAHTLFVVRGPCPGHDVSAYLPALCAGAAGRLVLLEPERCFRVLRVSAGSPTVVDVQPCPTTPFLADLVPVQQEGGSSGTEQGGGTDPAALVAQQEPAEPDARVRQALRGALRLALETNDSGTEDVVLQRVVSAAEHEAQHLRTAVRKELTQREIDEELEAVLSDCTADSAALGAGSGGAGDALSARDASLGAHSGREGSGRDEDDGEEGAQSLARLPLWKRLFFEQPTAASVEPNTRAMGKDAEDEIELLTKSVELACNPNILLPESETMQELDSILLSVPQITLAPPCASSTGSCTPDVPAAGPPLPAPTATATADPSPAGGGNNNSNGSGLFSDEALPEDPLVNSPNAVPRADTFGFVSEVPNTMSSPVEPAPRFRNSVALAPSPLVARVDRAERRLSTAPVVSSNDPSSSGAAATSASSPLAQQQGATTTTAQNRGAREKKHHGMWTKIRTRFGSSASSVLPNAQVAAVAAAAAAATPRPEELLALRAAQNLTAFPEIAAFPATLQCLDLSHNRLMRVPEELGTLTALRVLDLSDNSLTSIPTTVSDLKALTVLNLERNWLAAVPDCLGCLAALQCLNLDNNQLRVVPSMLAALAQLQELTLADNEVAGLTDNLLQHPGILVLTVVKNPCAEKLRGRLLPSGFPII